MYQIDEENSDILFEVSDKTVILKLKSGAGSGGSSPDIYLIKIADPTTPSDKNVFSALRAQSTFLRKDQVDSTSFLLKLLAGLETGEYSVGESGAKIDADGDAEVRNLIARIKATVAELEAKTVTVSDKVTTLNLLIQKLAETYDLSVSNVATLFRTIVKDYVSSETFVPGITGEGMKLYKALNGDWNLEVDNVTVRKAMTIFELIISKIRSVNGGLVVSPANGRINSVAETTGSPTYYVLGIEGDMTFVADDLVRCQVFSSTGAKYYWVRVDSISSNSIVILKSEFPDGVVPAIGDDLVQMGNKTNTARQGVLYLTASEDGKPRFSVLDGVNSTDLTGKNKVILGCLDGITDSDFPSDAQPSGYGLWAANVFLKGLFILRNGKSIEDELTDQITTVKTAFEIREGQISSKVQTATSAAEQASGSASAAASSASNAAGSASQASGVLVTVTQKETNINQTASDINLKAKRAESAAGRAETAESNINIKADGVVVQAASSAAKAAIDGVIVGGTNLFRYSKPINDNNQISNVYANGGSDLSIDYTNTYLGRPTLKITGLYGCYWAFNPTIEPGVVYTISAMVKGSIQVNATGDTPFHIQIPVGGHSYEHMIAYDDTITTGWKQVYRTFSSTAPANTNLRLYIYGIGTSVVNVAWVKLEKGNKATDWSAAQEDITADYTAKLQVLSDQISSKVSQTTFDSLSGTVNTHSTAITQLPTTIDARITSQTQDGGTIKTKVESWFSMVGNMLSMGAKQVNISGATIFSSTATKDEVATSINKMEVSTRNLFRMSDLSDDDAGYSTHAHILVRATLNRRNLTIAPITESGWYSLSYRIKVENHTGSTFSMVPNINDTPLAVYTGGNTAGWQLIKGSVYVGNYIGIYGFIDWEYDDPSATVYISDVVITKGTKPLENYIDAPEDVNAIIVAAQAAATTNARNNLATRLGYANYAAMEAQAIAGNTIINGGKIRTSLIDADAIVTGQLVANVIFSTNITTGKLTVTTGAKIGGFTINGSTLYGNSGGVELKLYPEYIYFKDSYKDNTVLIGGETIPSSGGGAFSCPTSFSSHRALANPSDGIGNIALILSAKGAFHSDYYSQGGNSALLLNDGHITGFRLCHRVVNSSQTLSKYDNMIFTERDGSDLTLTLPSDAERGQMLFIRKNGTGRVWIQGSYIVNDGDWVRERSTSVQLNRAGLGILMFNGTYWTWNNMNG